MKRMIWAFLALLIMSAPAYAGMNIRQNADGSTDWVDASGNTFNVGATYLTVYMSDAGSLAVTAAVAVPIPNAKVTKIYSAIMGNPAGSDTNLSFYAGTGLTYGSIGSSNQITNGTSPLTITQSGGNAGDVDTFTPTGGNSVTTGDVILITSDGGDSGTLPVTITIVVEPDGD